MLLTIVVVLVWAVVKLWPSGGGDDAPAAKPAAQASA
ncbi:MAG: TlpA family protein disulfide reductase, partial [Actinomycetales bacterium]